MRIAGSEGDVFTVGARPYCSGDDRDGPARVHEELASLRHISVMRSAPQIARGMTTPWRARAFVAMAVIMVSNAMAVATLYVPQVLQSSIFPDALERQDWLPITSVFLGYCVGNAATAFNLVPIISGSIRNHLGLLAVALLVTATAPTMQAFAASCFLTGVGASVASRLLGMAAHRAGPGRTGNAVACCVATALLAVLGLRVWGEQLATVAGWRTCFALMSVPFIGWFFTGRATSGDAVAPLMQDVPMNALRLIRSSAPLRRSMAQQAMVFATYNAAWVLLAAQLAPGERASTSFWGSSAGIASLMVGCVISSRGHARFLHRLGNAAMLIPGCPLLLLAYAGLTGPGLLVALPLGMASIDAGMQLTLVANQTRVQAIAPASKGRLASLLTISGALGGGVAGGASRWMWQYYGWQATLTLVALTAAVGLLVACAPGGTRDPMPERRRERRGLSPVRVMSRLLTTFPAVRWKADRNPCGHLVNQGSK